MAAPGPLALGRGVVIDAGQAVPEPWAAAPVVRIDEAELADEAVAAQVVGKLHRAWAAREPVVIELAVDPARFRDPVEITAEPWELAPELELWHDRLHHLAWANTYDARSGEPIWWWARKAARLGATLVDGEAGGDVVLADGTVAWIDGGPREPLAAEALGHGTGVVHSETVEAGELEPDRGAEQAELPEALRAELAPDQLAAVAHGGGPARVVAPAGSGKTRVLTARLRHLLTDRGWNSGSVLAVAYNVEARDEMRRRTGGIGARVQTLNGLSYQLLAEHRGGAPKVLEEREVRRLLDPLLPGRQHRANTDPVAPYIEALTRVRLGLRDPAEVEAERGDVPGLAELVGPYRERLAATGAVDFDEQVTAAIAALLGDGPFRRRMQQRHRHLLVDEFQDLTPAHMLLLRLLAAPGFDVFGVGDDDQVIYGYAGADPRFLIDFHRFFPAADEAAASHALEVNHRCPAAVTTAAATLLTHNRRRVPKVIRPGDRVDTDPGALSVRSHDADAGAVTLTEVVQGWLSHASVAPADVAVLARVNSSLLAPHVALAEAGVPVRSMVGPELLRRTGVRAALAWLRLAADPAAIDPSDLDEVQRRPSRGFPRWISKWFANVRNLDGLQRIAERIDDERVADKVIDLATDIAVVAGVAAKGTTATVLRAVRDDIGLAAAMERLDASKGTEGTSQLDDLDALVQVAALHPDLASFEAWLTGLLSRPAAVDGVTLSTIHRVKGREWPRVAVVGVQAGLLPHRLASDVEEERRVFHVAITRARHQAVVVADASRPSPLVAELHSAAPPPGEREPVSSRTGRARAAKARAGGAADSRGVAGHGETAHAGAVVSRTGRVRTRTAGSAGDATVDGEALSPEAQALEEALRAWRAERSKADGVPAYVVADNKTLAAIAEARPTSKAALGRVKGIGPKKVATYGDAILAIVDGQPPV